MTATVALAQQPDAAFLQKAITSLQAQRNAALDAQAGAEARMATFAEEVDKLKAQLAAKDKPIDKDAGK